jgi:hypothetical protein
MVDGLLGRAFHMVRRDWCAGEDTVTFCNHQVVALAEEMSEAMEHRWNGAPLFAELADVVIVANMLSFELRGRPVALRWATVVPAGAGRGDAMMDVAEAVGKVAKVWRQISGQRRRASSQPFTLLDMDAALTRVVTAARAVPPAGTLLPLADKLTKVLARGRSLDSSERVG